MLPFKILKEVNQELEKFKRDNLFELDVNIDTLKDARSQN